MSICVCDHLVTDHTDGAGRCHAIVTDDPEYGPYPCVCPAFEAPTRSNLDRVLEARIRGGLPPTPPCSTCDRTAVGYRSWPDGSFVAWCAEHNDTPQQTSLMEGA